MITLLHDISSVYDGYTRPKWSTAVRHFSAVWRHFAPTWSPRPLNVPRGTLDLGFTWNVTARLHVKHFSALWRHFAPTWSTAVRHFRLTWRHFRSKWSTAVRHLRLKWRHFASTWSTAVWCSTWNVAAPRGTVPHETSWFHVERRGST